MKYLLTSLTISLLTSNTAYNAPRTYGVTPVYKTPTNENVTQKTVVELIRFLQPAMPLDKADKVAFSVLKYSRDINLDWRLFISILFQESSLTLDPQNCYTNELHPLPVKVKMSSHGKVIYRTMAGIPKKCIDYGIAQINFRTWGEELGLNKELLVTNIDYSINAASKILFYYKHRYAKHDSKWHLRYHSNTPEFKNAYGTVIGKRFSKINDFVKSNFTASLK